MTTTDPEIEAMTTLSEALNGLEEQARVRVLRWAADRYGIRQALASGTGQANSGSQEALKEQGETFTHFVDLYDRVSPNSEVERAITGAYWLQVIQNQSSWQSRQVNDLLKDVGHGIGNITDALDDAQKRKPALVRQMAKSGRSRQARKTYKLTTSGISFVQARLGGEVYVDGEDTDE